MEYACWGDLVWYMHYSPGISIHPLVVYSPRQRVMGLELLILMISDTWAYYDIPVLGAVVYRLTP